MAEMQAGPEKKASAAIPAQTPKQAAKAAGEQLGYGARFFKAYGGRLAMLFLGLLLPLYLFATLVEDFRENGVLPFDKPIMLWLHQLATPGVDALFVTMSQLGTSWGVIPVDIVVLAFLVVSKRYREGLFFALAVGGSELLNLAAKQHFARIRPDFWVSIAPETTYSFPSGHAMGSATLAAALIVLAWRTRFHWPTVILAPAFALLVGLSRIYLGVHFPSDILAGFACGVAWVIAMQSLVARAPKPRAEPVDTAIEKKAQEVKAEAAKG
jgi:membrane-associated phospholipid phosphatase